MIRSFLWSGANELKYKGKVAWSNVCRDKKEGGLGVRRLHEWNLACMIYHIWNICSRKETMPYPLSSYQSRSSYIGVRSIESVAEFIARGRVWKSEAIFRCKNAWMEIRSTTEEVRWHKIVWGKGNVPAHSFITWLVCMCRHSTKDKLKRWKVVQEE
ncbi:hypothetical protein LIER_43068 [Lithospermum erythrorhizon]|uniref:Reverse transcriptase zinc-binding domain-containing protein n=1 Tax=Lithospermum erythrorhizon TaxID=34254 RepID=A0AAV3PHZ1_LITER